MCHANNEYIIANKIINTIPKLSSVLAFAYSRSRVPSPDVMPSWLVLRSMICAATLMNCSASESVSIL